MNDYLAYCEMEAGKSKPAIPKPRPTFSESPKCPRCDSEMLLREGPYGMFWGCSSFPECNGTRRVK